MAYETSVGKGRLKVFYHILIGLVALPFLLLRHAAVRQSFRNAIFGSARDTGLIYLNDPENRHRITFETVDSDRSLEQRASTEARLRAMAQAEDWIGIGKQLEVWDSAKTACISNYRLIHAGLEAATEALFEGADPKRCEGLDVARIPDVTVEDAMACFLEDPSRFGLAGFIVNLLLSQCWDLRGQSWADDVADTAWDKIADKIETAHTILQDARIDTRNSALLLGQRQDMLYFLPQVESHLFDWYEAAVKADPGDSAPHMNMGNMMLPRWFGDYEKLEAAARQGASWTRDTMGMSAYAILYNRALELEGVPIFFLDLELYTEAVHDLMRYRGNSPVYVAELSQFIYNISHYTYPQGMDDPEDRQHWDDKAQALYSLSLKLLEDHLTAVHVPSWDHGEDGALNLISRAMGQELAEGMNLVVGPNGIKAVAPPEPAPDAA